MGGSKQIRPRIKPEEYDIIQQHRGLAKECEKNGIPIEEVRNYWHKGKQYSIHVVRADEEGQDFYSRLKEVLGRELKKTYKPKAVDHKLDREGVLKWSDLHTGAHIRNLVLTQDYDADVLLNGLMASIQQMNSMGFKKAHVHINGDLIESFTGMNHVNSWMSINRDLIGANVIKFCVNLLATALSKVDNLGAVKIIGGNHDRTSKANDEDVKATAADLIAWGLELKGFDVEFHPYVITHQVEGINHINLHGDKKLSSRPTTDIIWNYGTKGAYNFVFEGHLHSVIGKLSASQRNKFKTIQDDSIDYRRMHLPSFFTGNYYSETLGFTTNPGYVIVWDNGKGKPNVFNGTV